MCFTSSIINENMGVELAGGVVTAEYNETVLFQCSAGYEETSVVYICTASGEFVPADDNDPINCTPGTNNDK